MMQHNKAPSRLPHQGHAAAGFTLIEVLVASAILALMALISWRGLDGMSKAQVALQTLSQPLD